MELPDCLPKSLHHYTFLPAMCEGSDFSISLLTVVIISLFEYSHPSGCEWYLIVVLIFISLMTDDVEHLFLYIFFTEMSVQIRHPSLIGLSFNYWGVRVLYIFWIQLSSDIFLANIFSHLVGCVLTLLFMSFASQKF